MAKLLWKNAIAETYIEFKHIVDNIDGNFWAITITYPDKYYPQLDHMFIKILGESSGSGMGFGKREKTWWYETKKDMDNARKKIVKSFDGIDI